MSWDQSKIDCRYCQKTGILYVQQIFENCGVIKMGTYSRFSFWPKLPTFDYFCSFGWFQWLWKLAAPKMYLYVFKLQNVIEHEDQHFIWKTFFSLFLLKYKGWIILSNIQDLEKNKTGSFLPDPIWPQLFWPHA